MPHRLEPAAAATLRFVESFEEVPQAGGVGREPTPQTAKAKLPRHISKVYDGIVR